MFKFNHIFGLETYKSNVLFWWLSIIILSFSFNTTRSLKCITRFLFLVRLLIWDDLLAAESTEKELSKAQNNRTNHQTPSQHKNTVGHACTPASLQQCVRDYTRKYTKARTHSNTVCYILLSVFCSSTWGIRKTLNSDSLFSTIFSLHGEKTITLRAQTNRRGNKTFLLPTMKQTSTRKESFKL